MGTIVINVLGFDAEIENGTWTSDNKTVARLLNLYADTVQVSPSDLNADAAIVRATLTCPVFRNAVIVQDNSVVNSEEGVIY